MPDGSQGIAADHLISTVNRIERLQDEIDALNADKAEVFKEAKALGYDVPALKLVISERRKRAKDEQKFDETSEIADLYRSIIGTPSRAHVHAHEGDA